MMMIKLQKSKPFQILFQVNQAYHGYDLVDLQWFRSVEIKINC